MDTPVLEQHPPDEGSPVASAPSRARRLAGFAACGLALLACEAIVFSYLARYGVSNVWKADSFTQHFPALYYIRQALAAFLRNPARGIDLWTWRLGFGADALTTLSYYIADPLALLSLLFPLHWVEYVYEGLYFLRLLLAGLAGYVYIRSFRATQVASTLGAIIYVFASFALFSCLRHSYFANAMIWFPLILLGIEQTLKGKRWYLLAFSVALASLGSFYFFYMISLIAIPYAVARFMELTPRGQRLKRLVSVGPKVGGLYALGVVVGGVVLGPALLAFFASSRSGLTHATPLFASAEIYRSYILALGTARNGAQSVFAGFSMLGFVMLPALFMRRHEHTTLKVMLTLFPLFLVFPYAGKVFNGFAFPSYRFLFMWGLFLAAAAAVLLSDRRRFSVREVAAMGAALVVYAGALKWAVGSTKLTAVATVPLAIGVATWLVLACDVAWVAWHGRRHLAAPADAGAAALDGVAARADRSDSRPGISKTALVGVSVLLVFNVTVLGVTTYARSFGNVLKDYMPFGRVLTRYQHNAGWLAPKLSAVGGFSRVDKQNGASASDLSVSQTNDPLVQGYDGIVYYYSVMSGDVLDYLKGLDNRAMRFDFDFEGVDDRAALEALNGVRFYLAPPKGAVYVPYGFEPAGTLGNVNLYRNRHPLPIGYVYHAAIDPFYYASLSPLDKQQALLQGVVVDPSAAQGLKRIRPATDVVDVPYSVTTTGTVHFDAAARVMKTRAPNTGLTMHMAPVPGAELYVDLTGVRFLLAAGQTAPNTEIVERPELSDITSNEPLRVMVSAGGPSKIERLQSPLSGYWWGDDSSLTNLGYRANGITTARLRFQGAATVGYSSLKVYAVPMTRFARRVAALAADGMRDVKVGTNSLSGTVTAHGAGVLFLSVPYSTGWSATVDGVPTPIVRANVGFSGVRIASGTHRIVLRYMTPGLVVCGVASGLGLLLLVLAAALTERRISARRKAATLR